MKEKGFTLIELLAVIVILAIIALIATPIILGIIRDAKEQANERSIDMYAKAIQNSIVKYQLKENKSITGKFEPKKLEIGENSTNIITDGKQELEIEYDGNILCNVVQIYEDSSIYLSECTVNNEEVKYTYGKKKIESGRFDSVCELSNDSTVQGKQVGAKYNCKVDPNKEEYIFYVLSYNDKSGNMTKDETQAETINLIMDSNIRIGGEAVKEEEPTTEQKGLVAWISEVDYGCGEIGSWCAKTDKGPLTAMIYLYKATSGWTNALPINYKYNDKIFQGGDYGYESFESTFGIASINGTQFTEDKLLRARLPIYSSDVTKTEVTYKEDENVYLYNYLQDVGIQLNAVEGVYGYWTLSSITGYFTGAWYVDSNGIVNDYTVHYANGSGVRPVITLEL